MYSTIVQVPAVQYFMYNTIVQVLQCNIIRTTPWYNSTIVQTPAVQLFMYKTIVHAPAVQ